MLYQVQRDLGSRSEHTKEANVSGKSVRFADGERLLVRGLQLVRHSTSNLSRGSESQTDSSGVPFDRHFLNTSLFLFVQEDSGLLLKTSLLLETHQKEYKISIHISL